MTAPTYDNPRQDVPSCSNLERLDACPISFHLEQAYPEKDSDDSTSGRRGHDWLATESYQDWVAMSEDEQDVATQCVYQIKELASDTFMGAKVVEWREIRLGVTRHGKVVVVHPGDQNELIYTGKFDRLMFDGRETALLIDTKTLWGEHAPAPINAQLRGLAPMVAEWTGAKRVIAAISQPRKGPPTVTEFDQVALSAAKSWAMTVAWDAIISNQAWPNPKAGNWCHFCKHLANCSAVQNTVANAVTATVCAVPLPADDKGAKLAIHQRAKQLTPEQLGTALDGLKLVDWYSAAIKTAAKDNPPPGWGLKEGNTLRKVALLSSGAPLAMLAFLLTADEMWPAFSISLPTLEALIRNKGAKDAKGKPIMSKTDARDLVEEALGDLIEYTQAAPKLVRIGAIEDGAE